MSQIERGTTVTGNSDTVRTNSSISLVHWWEAWAQKSGGDGQPAVKCFWADRSCEGALRQPMVWWNSCEQHLIWTMHAWIGSLITKSIWLQHSVPGPRPASSSFNLQMIHACMQRRYAVMVIACTPIRHVADLLSSSGRPATRWHDWFNLARNQMEEATGSLLLPNLTRYKIFYFR